LSSASDLCRSDTIWVCPPALEGEAFFTDLVAATATGDPDPALLAKIAQRFGTEIVGPPLGG